jgi:hypothetical protein
VRPIIRLVIGSNTMERTSAGLQWLGITALLVDWRWGPAIAGDVGWWLYVGGAVALIAGILLVFACKEAAGPIVAVAGLAGIAASAAFLLLVQAAVVVHRYARRYFI